MKKALSFIKLNLLTGSLALFFNLAVQAQNGPQIQWNKTIGGNDRDFYSSFFATSDGGYIMGGPSWSGISGDKSQNNKGWYDYWIIKVDASGNKQWDKSFGGNQDDILGSIQQTSDGGYILAGSSNSGISLDKSQPNIGSFDCWLIKIDASGNKVWDKTIGGTGEDRLITAKQTSDGGYILGGFSDSGISGDKTQDSKGGQDYWIIKVNASGTIVWDKIYGGNDRDRLYDLQITSDGGYIIGGFSASGLSGDKTQAAKGGSGTSDYWVLKLDHNGAKDWDKTFGGTNNDELTALQQTTDGGYIFGGYSNSGLNGDKSQASKGNYDYWVVKTNSAGIKTWDKTFGGSNQDRLFALQQAANGTYVIGGMSESGAGGDKTQATKGMADFWVMKLDANGNKIWDKTAGGSGEDYLFTAQSSPDGSYILAGYSESGQSGDKTQPSKGDRDFWLLKLTADITGIQEAKAGISISISPNPNKGKFMLEINNLPSKKAAVLITDLLGRNISQKTFSSVQDRISQEISLPAEKGIYFLHINSGNQTSIRKIIVE